MPTGIILLDLCCDPRFSSKAFAKLAFASTTMLTFSWSLFPSVHCLYCPNQTSSQCIMKQGQDIHWNKTVSTRFSWEVVQIPSLDIFKTWLRIATGNLVWYHSWFSFKQEVEPGTSWDPFQLEGFSNSIFHTTPCMLNFPYSSFPTPTSYSSQKILQILSATIHME